jgi:predicted nucleotidyltransferase
VTRIDEHGPAIKLDAGALERLRAALEREEVAAAYLYGSAASGRSGPLSDVDVAVWSRPGLDAEARFRLGLALTGAAAAALGTDAVQVVVLDDAPPLLRHRAWKGGRLLVDSDPVTRVRGEARALIEYLDTAPLRAQLARGLRRRLSEDRFGRP